MVMRLTWEIEVVCSGVVLDAVRCRAAAAEVEGGAGELGWETDLELDIPAVLFAATVCSSTEGCKGRRAYWPDELRLGSSRISFV